MSARPGSHIDSSTSTPSATPTNNAFAATKRTSEMRRVSADPRRFRHHASTGAARSGTATRTTRVRAACSHSGSLRWAIHNAPITRPTTRYWTRSRVPAVVVRGGVRGGRRGCRRHGSTLLRDAPPDRPPTRRCGGDGPCPPTGGSPFCRCGAAPCCRDLATDRAARLPGRARGSVAAEAPAGGVPRAHPGHRHGDHPHAARRAADGPRLRGRRAGRRGEHRRHGGGRAADGQAGRSARSPHDARASPSSWPGCSGRSRPGLPTRCCSARRSSAVCWPRRCTR